MPGRPIFESKPMTADVMDRFNLAMQELIQECETAGYTAMALEFAQIKLQANKRFHGYRSTIGTEIPEDRSANLAGREI